MDLRELAVNALAQNKKAALLIGGAGVAVLGLGLGYKYLRKPEKVVRVGVVSQLLIHPLKSGKAVSVALAECQKTGLKFGELQDRWVSKSRWSPVRCLPSEWSQLSLKQDLPTLAIVELWRKVAGLYSLKYGAVLRFYFT